MTRYELVEGTSSKFWQVELSVGRLSWRLRVPDGKLVVCGGVEYVMEAWDPDEDDGDYGADYRHVMAVPAGTYHATLYGFLQGVNGEHLLERAGGPAKGWPKGEPEDGPETIGFLLHLQPDGAAPLPAEPPETEDGWLSWNAFETRRPARYPAGVPAKDVVRTSGAEEKHEPEPPAAVVRVAPLVADRALLPIEGGPVAIPTEELAHLYRLAWYACGATHPEVVIEHENAKNLAGFFNPLAGIEAQVDGHRLAVGFPAGFGRWQTLERLESFSSQWANMPEGSILELDACAPRVDDRPLRADGLMRFRGKLAGRLDTSVWHVSEAYPVVTADTLRAALESAAGADERELTLPSAALSKDTAGRWKRVWAWEYENKLSVDGTTLRFKRADRRAQLLLAGCAFRAAHGSTWPVFLEEDEAGEAPAEAPPAKPSPIERPAPGAAAAPFGKGPATLKAVGSPMAGALRWGRELFDKLLAAAKDVSEERHALTTAALVGELGPLRALLDRGAGKYARYALKMAAEGGQYSAVKMLLEACPDWKEYPALRIPQAARQAGHTEIHELLMGQPHDEAKALAVETEKKALVARSRDQMRENVAKRKAPPAERKRLLGMVREAVAAGVLGPGVIDKPQVDAGDWGKITPLMAAARAGDLALVEALLAAGAKATVKVKRAQTARHFARGPHRERMLELFARHGEKKPRLD